MNTLLLRLKAPMQSWGTQSNFVVRDTGREPSKSGVIGLLCAALGRPREAPLDDLAGLRMGVRVDQEGTIATDYQIAQNVFKASRMGTKDAEVSHRFYLADAAFLAGLESENLTLLRTIYDALQHPHWQLFLGRKAFVPGEPVWLPDGLKSGEELIPALCAYPYLGTGKLPEKVRLIIEDEQGELLRKDQPLSFAERRFAQRRVNIRFFSFQDGHLKLQEVV